MGGRREGEREGGKEVKKERRSEGRKDSKERRREYDIKKKEIYRKKGRNEGRSILKGREEMMK